MLGRAVPQRGVDGSSGAPGSGAATGNNAPPTSSFSGLVADRNGLAIGGVSVTVYLDNDHSEHTTTTDSAGHYTVAGLPVGWPYGHYQIWADKAGYAFLPGIGATEGTIIKSDHNALFKTVIAIDARTSRTVADANFTALRASDKLVGLPRSGQLTSYVSGDDAALARGIAWPTARFIDNNNGTISDMLTGLAWLKDAGCIAAQNCSSALTAVSRLASGACGLTDGSTSGQWRMPNRTEMLSLVDRAETNQALRFNSVYLKANGSVDQAAVFDTVRESEFYWTSTTKSDITQAWTLYSCDYGVYNIDKVNLGYSLAVR